LSLQPRTGQAPDLRRELGQTLKKRLERVEIMRLRSAGGIGSFLLGSLGGVVLGRFLMMEIGSVGRGGGFEKEV
jgi:hypothetical protein